MELYIKEWRKKASQIQQACGLRRRLLRRRQTPAVDDDDSVQVVDDLGVVPVDDDLWIPNVNNYSLPLHTDDDFFLYDDDGVETDDRNLGVLVQRPYFDRVFLPYVWYA